MTDPQKTSRPRRTLVSLTSVRARVVALLAAIAVLIGAGVGGVLALWSDQETVTGRMPVGVAVFGVGSPTSVVYATSDAPVPGEPGRNSGTLTFTLPAAAATTLYNGNVDAGGAVAIPIRVDSLAQGHRGLTYDLELTIAPGGVVEDATVETYKVATASQCTTARTGASDPLHATPWEATYTSTTVIAQDYWCLVARYVPTRWAHSNTATVTAPNPVTSGTLTASSSWSATARRTHVPSAEPNHTVTFEYTTFRPGDTP